MPGCCGVGKGKEEGNVEGERWEGEVDIPRTGVGHIDQSPLLGVRRRTGWNYKPACDFC